MALHRLDCLAQLFTLFDYAKLGRLGSIYSFIPDHKGTTAKLKPSHSFLLLCHMERPVILRQQKIHSIN